MLKTFTLALTALTPALTPSLAFAQSDILSEQAESSTTVSE